MQVINMRKIEKGGLIAEFELYLEFNNMPLFVIPGWKLLRRKDNGELMVMSPRTLYTDYKTKQQKEGSIFKGRLNPKVEEIIFNLAIEEYGGPEPTQLQAPIPDDDIPF